MKATTNFSHFEELDIRVGRITEVLEAKTKKPTYKIQNDNRFWPRNWNKGFLRGI
jgi:hypothetical protein